MRRAWTALPDSLTAAIAEHAGGTHVIPSSAGDHAEIAATVAGSAGKVFIKGACSEHSLRLLRYELRVNLAVAQSLGPAVQWHFEADGWLVAGFEHLDGPHADLSPASPDLGLLAELLQGLAQTPAADQRWLTPEGRLGFSLPAMDGNMVVHSDLNPANLIVTPDGLRAVDWAFATKAAPWVELALLAPWLIGSGHRPEQADQWLARLPAWSATDPQVLDGFAARNAAKWAVKAQQRTDGWVQDLADWTGRWAAHRRARR